MSVSKIISVPNSILRKRSKKVAVIDKNTKSLAEQMQAEALKWEKNRPHETGVAMAAVQIGTPMRVIIVRRNEDKASKPATFDTYINPKIIRMEGTLTTETEGCLSVPDLYGAVPRYSKVKIKAIDLNGRELRIKAEGFMARILQHEIDHLEGKLFTDRMTKKSFYKINREGELIPLGKDEVKKIDFLR